MTDDFFAEQSEESRVKTEIVAKFFASWSNVILGAQRGRGKPLKIGYVDLFAGRGRFADGAPSTPLLVLQHAIENADHRHALTAVFNEADAGYRQHLLTNINALPGVNTLTRKPIYLGETVDSDYGPFLKQVKGIPTLFFVDPWGYIGVSVELLRSAVQQAWGSDLIFFFNYKRICAGLSNDLFAERMKAIFGTRYATLRKQVEHLHGDAREEAITAAMAEELAENAAEHVLKFRIERRGATSHYVFFISKSAKGRRIMADIMAGVSSERDQGVVPFEFSRASKEAQQTSLFEAPMDSLGDLAGELLRLCADKTMTTAEIFALCTFPGKNYQMKNYKQALMRLEAEGKIITSPAAAQRKKGTFGDAVAVKFPGVVR
ncbi:MAG: three-Cys-motif partner protein TcmP [Acidobacteriota bacterium]